MEASNRGNKILYHEDEQEDENLFSLLHYPKNKNSLYKRQGKDSLNLHKLQLEQKLVEP